MVIKESFCSPITDICLLKTAMEVVSLIYLGLCVFDAVDVVNDIYLLAIMLE